MIVIADTAPIISLLKINRLDLLQELFGTVFIPQGVYDELTQNEKYELEAKVILNSDFIQNRHVLNQEAVHILETITQLDKGESEAIILFRELNAQLLLIDERRGRDVAEQLQIPLSGTISILLKAFDNNLLTRQQVLEYLDIFQQESIRFSPKLINLVNDTFMMNKVYGYCRISTPKQNIERQVRNILKEYPDAMIVQETYSGTHYQGRKELEKLIRTVQAGDTIIFDSVSRMSRNAKEGFALYEQLYSRGVELVFLKEPHINTDTYRKTLQEKQISLNIESGDEAADRLMQTILDALNDYILSLAKKQIQLAFVQSQKEVDDLHQRTREGIETARRNGKQIGQQKGRKLNITKKAPIQKLILKHSKTFGGSNSDSEVIAIINASYFTPEGQSKPVRLHVSNNTYYKYKAELRQ